MRYLLLALLFNLVTFVSVNTFAIYAFRVCILDLYTSKPVTDVSCEEESHRQMAAFPNSASKALPP